MTPGNWQAASACGTWLWWPCRPRRGPTWRCARVRACRWHTDWRGQGRWIHPELPQPACLDEMTWPSGRTLQTSNTWGRMRLYGLCKMGDLGALACRGGHRSRQYRRLWPRRGKLHRLASFRRNSFLLFQWGRPAARTCYMNLNSESSVSISTYACYLYVNFCFRFYSHNLPTCFCLHNICVLPMSSFTLLLHLVLYLHIIWFCMKLRWQFCHSSFR